MKQPMKIDHKYVTFRVDPTKSACRVDFIDTEKRAIVEQVFVNLGEGDGRKSFVDMTEFMGMTLDVQMLPCESEWALQPEGVLTEDEAEARRRFIACEDDYITEADIRNQESGISPRCSGCAETDSSNPSPQSPDGDSPPSPQAGEGAEREEQAPPLQVGCAIPRGGANGRPEGTPRTVY